MDLLGIDLMAKRAKVAIVLLKKDGQWSLRETGILVGWLKPMACVTSHPQHLGTILIEGGPWTKGEIAGLLNTADFSYEVVMGLDNPKLPFQPQI